MAGNPEYVQCPMPDVSMYAAIEYVPWPYVMLLKMLKMDAGVMKNTETHSEKPECDSDVWSELCLGHMIHNHTLESHPPVSMYNYRIALVNN